MEHFTENYTSAAKQLNLLILGRKNESPRRVGDSHLHYDCSEYRSRLTTTLGILYSQPLQHT